MPLEFSITLPVLASFTISDNNGKLATVEFNLPAGLTLGDYTSAVAALETGLAAITNGRIDSARVTLPYTQPASYVYVAPPESEVERKLVVTFVDASGRYKFIPQVPSPLFTLESNGTNDVDLANAALQTFTDAVLNGAFGPVNGARTIAGFDLTRVTKATVRHRNRQG